MPLVSQSGRAEVMNEVIRQRVSSNASIVIVERGLHNSGVPLRRRSERLGSARAGFHLDGILRRSTTAVSRDASAAGALIRSRSGILLDRSLPDCVARGRTFSAFGDFGWSRVGFGNVWRLGDADFSHQDFLRGNRCDANAEVLLQFVDPLRNEKRAVASGFAGGSSGEVRNTGCDESDEGQYRNSFAEPTTTVGSSDRAV